MYRIYIYGSSLRNLNSSGPLYGYKQIRNVSFETKTSDLIAQ